MSKSKDFLGFVNEGRWESLSDKQRKNIAVWLDRNSGNSYYKGLADYLKKNGKLTDDQLAKVPDRAYN